MPKKPKKTDPHSAREAEKYERPIPSREFILDCLADAGVPQSFDEIAHALDLKTDDEYIALERRLGAMVRDGQIGRNRRNTYGLLEKMRLIPGRILGHKDGFGFLTPDDGEKDLFLSAKEMRLVFHGDHVIVREGFADRRGRREGKIVKILEHNTKRLVGRYFEEQGVAFVRPDNVNITQDVMVQPTGLSVPLGSIVVVDLIQYPTETKHAIGKVVEVLGEHMAPGMEIEVALRSHDLPYQFSPEVLAEIADWTEEVPASACEGREDLRALDFVTIDGEDARDFDDAVYAEKTKGGYKLYVAIADVSAYVKPGTALDESAYERGNSVYFPSRVIPMLPEILSNGLCSLKPKVDRLAMVCEMHISNAGEIKQADFYDAVIHSKERLTYTRVAAFLNGGEHDIPQALIPAMKTLYSLYERLRHQREQRGAIDFETIETQIIFNDEKKIEKIVPRERNEAHKLIEECMLAANESVALFLLHEKVPILYRVHDQPGPEKIEELREFLKPLGLQLGGDDNPQPKHYAKLLTAIRTREDKHLLQMVLLRSLSQATYSPDNLGHFGLAYDAYTHFTSPIRRYPDLLVHRAIKAILDHHIDSEQFNEKTMTAAGIHCSMTERRADDATRDVTAWLKCEYMQDNVGGEFLGFITGITGFGFFVELKDIYVEGLVHVSSLDNDYYQYDATHHTLIGERTGVIYSISDQVKVRVASVNLDDRKIDFSIIEQVTAQKRTLGDKNVRQRRGHSAEDNEPKSKKPAGSSKRRRPSSKRKKS